MYLVIVSLIAMVTLVTSVNSINQMDKRTPLPARLAYIIVGVAALGVLLTPFFARPPISWTDLLSMTACMLLMRAHTHQAFCEIAPHAQSTPR